MTAINTHSPSVIRAPAKLTWSLAITGRRNDGYHLLDAEMMTLDLCDVVVFEDDQTGIVIDGPFGGGIPTDERNLVHRALNFVGRQARVSVTKNIPHGGGLGGGSADAAAVLRWAGRSSPNDIRQSATIGADVPFCVVGGRARVRGIGEIVEPLPYVDRRVTLVIPPLHVSTPAVYRTWDELQSTNAPPSLEAPPGERINDLEMAALRVEPSLQRWRDRIREACGVNPTLAGSGATWFVPGSFGHVSDALTEAQVIEARTIPAT